jgi:hypothetical protein
MDVKLVGTRAAQMVDMMAASKVALMVDNLAGQKVGMMAVSWAVWLVDKSVERWVA